tara:strand:- start:791 stop:1543 length:753 start_codon:yes stop_codon:yes gene_type:complete
MAYGVEVKNASGFVQINDSDKSMQVIASGVTADLSSSYVNGTLATSMPSGAGTDVVVFIAPNATSGPSSFYNSASAWGFINYSTNKFHIGSTAGLNSYLGSYKYVVCKPNTVAPTSGYGFNTYVANGDLAYSSQYDQMKGLVHQTVNLATGNSYQFDENNSLWDAGTHPQDYYVMINALGITGHAPANPQNTGSVYYAAYTEWNWGNSIAPTERIIVGANFAITSHVSSYLGSAVQADDTRTQIIARRIF